MELCTISGLRTPSSFTKTNKKPQNSFGFSQTYLDYLCLGIVSICRFSTFSTAQNKVANLLSSPCSLFLAPYPGIQCCHHYGFNLAFQPVSHQSPLHTRFQPKYTIKHRWPDHTCLLQPPHLAFHKSQSVCLESLSTIELLLLKAPV